MYKIYIPHIVDCLRTHCIKAITSDIAHIKAKTSDIAHIQKHSAHTLSVKILGTPHIGIRKAKAREITTWD